MSPAARSVSGVTSPDSSCLRWATLTVWLATRNGLVKPRFGSRRYIGIWPPSKPGLVPPPVRALWPLLPLPDVLPRPEPGPRPTRLRDWVLPGAGERSWSFISALDDFDQIGDFRDHTPHGRAVDALDLVSNAAQAEAAQRLAVVRLGADRAAHLP